MRAPGPFALLALLAIAIAGAGAAPPRVLRRSCAECPPDLFCEYGEPLVACAAYSAAPALYRRYAAALELCHARARCYSDPLGVHNGAASAEPAACAELCTASAGCAYVVVSEADETCALHAACPYYVNMAGHEVWALHGAPCPEGSPPD